MKELIYDFLCSSCFLVAENALDSSDVLILGIAQKKSQATTSQCGLMVGVEKER